MPGDKHVDGLMLLSSDKDAVGVVFRCRRLYRGVLDSVIVPPETLSPGRAGIIIGLTQ